jgi:hypothetical protein
MLYNEYIFNLLVRISWYDLGLYEAMRIPMWYNIVLFLFFLCFFELFPFAKHVISLVKIFCNYVTQDGQCSETSRTIEMGFCTGSIGLWRIATQYGCLQISTF